MQAPTSDPVEMIDRMIYLAKNERMIRGNYSHHSGDTPPDAPCGGNQFCAIGSLWWAASEYTTIRSTSSGHQIVLLNSVADGSRGDVLARNEPLNRAYEALDEAAREWWAEHYGTDIDDDERVGSFNHAAERVFEGYAETADEYNARYALMTEEECEEAVRKPAVDDAQFVEICELAKAKLVEVTA